MIIIWFLLHQWKEMIRSPFWNKSIGFNVLISILLLLAISNLFILGFSIDIILEKLYPDKDPVSLFNGIILYFLLVELLMRKVLQSLPKLNIEAYLHLPVRKNIIVHYVAFKSVFAVGNYLSWLVFVPFAYKVIAPVWSNTMASLWLIVIISLVFNNNFLATYIKRQMAGKAYISLLILLLAAGLILMDKYNIFQLTAASSFIFDLLLQNPILAAVPISLPVLSYLLNYYYLKPKLYPEEIVPADKTKSAMPVWVRSLKKLGTIGSLLSLDLMLVWRNKRPRSIVFLAPIFLGYGLVFYPQQVYSEMTWVLIFIGSFITGGMMLNYTNYCFSYESGYFDNVLTLYRDYRKYIRSKFILAISVSTLCYLLTIPYVYFGTQVLFINTVTFLYNTGVASFILLYMATYSTKSMDLTRNAAFNYQGLGITHWLSMLPAFLLPVFTYLLFSWTDNPDIGLYAIGGLGVLGLLLNSYLTGVVTRQFINRKHHMAEGFRE